MERQQFISDETTTIAQIHFANFGYHESARVAKGYLQRADKHTQNLGNPISRRKLSETINQVNYRCEYLLTYVERLAKFKESQAEGVMERVTKLIIILITRGNLSFIHSNLSHSLMALHSDLSSDLYRELESQQKRVVN